MLKEAFGRSLARLLHTVYHRNTMKFLRSTWMVSLFIAHLLVPATAEAKLRWPDNLYAGTVGASFRVGTTGIDVGIHARFSWIDLRATVPLGASLETQWLLYQSALRVHGSALVVPDEPLHASLSRS